MESSNSEETQKKNVIPLLMRVDKRWVDSIQNPSQFADSGLERWVSQSSNSSTPVVFYVIKRNDETQKVLLWVYQNGIVKRLPSGPGYYEFDREADEHGRILCTDQFVFSVTAVLDNDELKYDIEKLNFVKEKPEWEQMPAFKCRDPLEALISDSDANKTYIWSAPRWQTEYMNTDADNMSDGDGSGRRQPHIWTVYDLHGWTRWTDPEDEKKVGWKMANPYSRTNADFPNRPPKYLEITKYIGSSKTHVMESLYKRFQLTQYALSHNPRHWAPESHRAGDILIFQDHKSPNPVTALYTMSQIVPGQPMLEEAIYKAELQNGSGVRPNVEDWDAFRQKWRECIRKESDPDVTVEEKSAMKLFWDANRNAEQDEWPDRPFFRWEREFGIRGLDSFDFDDQQDLDQQDLEIFVTQNGPIYVYGSIGAQTYSIGDPNKERVMANNFHWSFPAGGSNFDPISLEVTDENGDQWTVLDSGSAQQCLDQTTHPSES